MPPFQTNSEDVTVLSGWSSKRAPEDIRIPLTKAVLSGDDVKLHKKAEVGCIV